jgi:CheY-like chemotaxis protein
MEAVGVLAGGVAHDFNNILGINQGYSAILMRELQGEESRRALLAEIQSATERAVSLTRQLMLFTRQQVADPRVFDLVELLSGTTKMLTRVLGDDVQVVLRALTPRALLLADSGQLEQVLANLAANARDAMPKGGTLTLEVARADLTGAAASEAGVVPGSYVVLSVTDTGIGLDVATKARVFEPFFTTKPSGKATGLGLATVFGIVRQNGGHIAVESEPGRGATFRIWLPLAAEGSAPPPPPNQLLTGAETLLVVDDEPRLRALACTVLRGAGYTVLDAQSGGDALLVLEQHPEIALLLTDVVMPLMSGDQLVERATKLRPGLPAVFMSGYTGIGAPQGRDLGSVPLVQKPFKPESLLRAVRTALEHGSGG